MSVNRRVFAATVCSGTCLAHLAANPASSRDVGERTTLLESFAFRELRSASGHSHLLRLALDDVFGFPPKSTAMSPEALEELDKFGWFRHWDEFEDAECLGELQFCLEDFGTPSDPTQVTLRHILKVDLCARLQGLTVGHLATYCKGVVLGEGPENAVCNAEFHLGDMRVSSSARRRAFSVAHTLVNTPDTLKLHREFLSAYIWLVDRGAPIAPTLPRYVALVASSL